MEALLIIDMQNDFMPGGALAVAEGDKIIPYINSIMKAFPLVIATQDKHPAKHISFATTHNRQPGELIDLNGHQQILWPEHCIEGTIGVECHPKLDQTQIDVVVEKGCDPLIDSYSGFFDNHKVRETPLHSILQNAQVSKLSIVGVATDYCVKYTVLDALELGYSVRVLTKGCRAVNLHSDDGQKALQEMKAKGAEIENGDFSL